MGPLPISPLHSIHAHPSPVFLWILNHKCCVGPRSSVASKTELKFHAVDKQHSGTCSTMLRCALRNSKRTLKYMKIFLVLKAGFLIICSIPTPGIMVWHKYATEQPHATQRNATQRNDIIFIHAAMSPTHDA